MARAMRPALLVVGALMPTERDFDWLKGMSLENRERIIRIETWIANQTAKTDSSARWAIALLSAGIAMASLLLNYWVYAGGGH